MVNLKTNLGGGGVYLGDLILGASFDWVPPDGDIAGGAHGEERGSEQRNEEKRRKKMRG
jgi:hypothetical protein